jgi:VanZ family protein
LWIAVILILSLLPKNQFAEPPFQGFDLIVHFGMYLILALCYLFESFKAALFDYNLFKISILLVLLTSLVGGSAELLQEALIPGRTGDINDFLFNLIGMLAGLLLFKVVYKSP